jgi:hypothetical protein
MALAAGTRLDPHETPELRGDEAAGRTRQELSR